MNNNIIIEVFNSEEKKLKIKINNVENLNPDISFKNLSEFKIYIEKILKKLIKLIYEAKIPNDYRNVRDSIINFKNHIDNIFSKEYEYLINRFKTEFLLFLDLVLIENKKINNEFLKENNTPYKLDKLFFELKKKIYDLESYIYNFQDSKDINPKDLFQSDSAWFRISNKYVSNSVSCTRNVSTTKTDIKFNNEDIEKIKKFINSLKDFRTEDCSPGWTYFSDRFISADSLSINFTLIGSILKDENKIEEEFGTIKINDNTFIDLDKNKIMYNILKKMINGKNFTWIHPCDMSNKINTFNFYYKNPDILDLQISLDKDSKLVKLGNYFNALEFKHSEDYNKIILANYSEIDKFKDELSNPKTACYLFFTEEGIKYSLRKYKAFKNPNLNIQIYLGTGELKKELKRFYKNIINKKEKSTYIPKEKLIYFL